MAKAHGGYSVFTGVGERTREGNDLYHEMIETGVIQLKNDKSKAALVFGQMNEPPGARARVALTGLTIAEYFRDVEGQDVLLFIDVSACTSMIGMKSLKICPMHSIEYLPIYTSWFRSVCPARPYSFRRRIPAHPE